MERGTSVRAGRPSALLSSPSLMVPVQVHGPDELPCVTHKQHTQMSSAGAIKYSIRSSSVLSSLHLEGPGRHALLFRGHCSRAQGPSCSLVPLHSESSLPAPQLRVATGLRHQLYPETFGNLSMIRRCYLLQKVCRRATKGRDVTGEG